MFRKLQVARFCDGWVGRGAVFSCAMGLVGCCQLREPLAKWKPSAKATRLTVIANKPWNDFDYHLRKGRMYRVTARVKTGPCVEPYKDHTLPCTPDGPATALGCLVDAVARDARFPLNPVRLVGPGKIKHLRVLNDWHDEKRRASFLTLIALINRDEQKPYVIGSEREFKAYATGPLTLFSNDWPGGPGKTGDARFQNSGSYKNNHGELEVFIEPIASGGQSGVCCSNTGRP